MSEPRETTFVGIDEAGVITIFARDGRGVCFTRDAAETLSGVLKDVVMQHDEGIRRMMRGWWKSDEETRR